MNIQPINTHQCYGQCNCREPQKADYETKVLHEKSKTATDVFERSGKCEDVPKDDKVRNRMFGVMFSSGGGTN